MRSLGGMSQGCEHGESLGKLCLFVAAFPTMCSNQSDECHTIPFIWMFRTWKEKNAPLSPSQSLSSDRVRNRTAT
jgi:hypothetical protein